MSEMHGEQHEKEASHERWLVSYADFITLMFAFFAVLYATSEHNLYKTKQFEHSIKRYLIKAGAMGDSGQKINEGQKNNTPIDQPIKSYNQSSPAATKVMDKAQLFIESSLTPAERKKYVLDLSSDEWGVRLTLASNAIFSKGSDKFQPGSVKFIDKLAGLLAATKRRALIEGHVSTGQKGSYRSTWDFASARAINFLRYVQARESLSGAELSAASLGDSRPLYTEPDKKALNSRLEIVLLTSDLDL